MRAGLLALALAGSGCFSASTTITLAPPRPMICRDGMPLRILQHPDCTNGICGYTCQPGRWQLKETTP
jgi:hypothetical protein